MKKEKYAEALAYCVNCQLTFERAAQIIKINNH